MTAPDYASFLASKRAHTADTGRHIDPNDLHPALHPWQAEVVAWAVRRGRAALWEDTGLGKTRQSLVWAQESGQTTLVVAPLAVSTQTVREAAQLGIDACYVRSGDQITGPGVWITNYEMADRFDPAVLDAVVLDEASILKNSTGKTRTRLIGQFNQVPRRLSCTATPAPNDPEELTNQSEFLGVMSRVDMLASYFVHDDQGWRVKGHARDAMYDWMAQWAMALRRPSDLGYPDGDYELPGLDMIPELLPVDVEPADGELFAAELGGVSGRARARRQTLDARCQRAAELVDAEPGEPWLLWCDLNDEADRLAKLIPGAVNVHGSMSADEKTELLLAFTDGEIPVLVSKASICGHGMNWQHCARMAFVGMRDSFESQYQAIRRCYRYGQTRPVRVHLVLSEIEAQIASNVARKQREAEATRSGLVTAMQRNRTRPEVAA